MIKITTLIDSYIESPGEHLECEVSEAEQDLFEVLGYIFKENDQKTFDAIQLNDDWTVLDQDDREDIIEKILNIISDSDVMTLNRYLRARSMDELKQKADELESKLKTPSRYRFEKRLDRIHDLFPKDEISAALLIEIGQHMENAIKVFDKDGEGSEIDSSRSLSDQIRLQYEKISQRPDGSL